MLEARLTSLGRENERLLLGSLISELTGDPAAPHLLERLPDCQLERLAGALRLPGRDTRLLEVDRVALDHVPLPALVMLAGEQLVVLREVSSRRVSIERAPGAHEQLERDDFLAASAGLVLGFPVGLPREGSYLARLLAFLFAQRLELLKLALLSLALTLLGLAGPLITELVMDRALPERAARLLLTVALATLLLSLQRALFGWLEQRVATALSSKLSSATASHMFDHLLRIPYAVLSREQVGTWLEALSSAQTVQAAVTGLVLMPLMHALMALLYGGLLVRYHAGMAVALLVGALLLVAISLCFARLQSRHERLITSASARQHSSLFELLSGVMTLRTCGAEQRGVLRWLSRAVDVRSTDLRMDRLAAWERVLLSGTREAIGLLVLFWSASACLASGLSVGALLAMVMLADRFVDAVFGLASVVTPISTARTHLARVDALLAQPDVTRSGPSRSLVDDAHAAVLLEDVWFRYAPDQPWILRGYSLRVESGARFELRGPSGMGKSTILRLIAGLYTPERGTVRVFGHAPGELREQIIYLPQEAHLFEGSIKQNLELLSAKAPFESLLTAAEDSGLKAWVDSLPMGFETVLPAGGANLSGGQRQLLVWTAAMASERKLLLMDEALSQVDRLTRSSLLKSERLAHATTVSVEHER